MLDTTKGISQQLSAVTRRLRAQRCSDGRFIKDSQISLHFTLDHIKILALDSTMLGLYDLKPMLEYGLHFQYSPVHMKFKD